MKLLEEIRRDAVSTGVPLAELLRKCLVLASRLGNGEFKSWVNYELNGYPVK